MEEGRMRTKLLWICAAALLLHSDLSMGAISQTVGYGDECYFSRCFSRWAGCAPSVYRKRNTEK